MKRRNKLLIVIGLVVAKNVYGSSSWNFSKPILNEDDENFAKIVEAYQNEEVSIESNSIFEKHMDSFIKKKFTVQHSARLELEKYKELEPQAALFCWCFPIVWGSISSISLFYEFEINNDRRKLMRKIHNIKEALRVLSENSSSIDMKKKS